MTLEMQRLYLSELKGEIENIERIMFEDNCTVNDTIMDCLLRFHRELVENKPPVCFLEFPKGVTNLDEWFKKPYEEGK